MALEFVHAKRVLHRDIKTSNVFLTNRNLVKLGDFGIARQMDDTSDFAKTCVGTPYYLSPELIEGRPYDHLSDVWALGVLLFQMVAFRYPFEAPTLPALALKIVACDHCPYPEGSPQELRELIGTLLARSQSVRPSMEQVMQLPAVLRRKNHFEQQMQRLWRPNERPVAASQAPAGAGEPAGVVAEAAPAEVNGATTTQLGATGLAATSAQLALGATAGPSVLAMLPPSHSGPFPLEPTPLDVSAADRELLASQFAEAGETLYCIACVHKVGERAKRSERTLAVGEHRLLVLKPKKKGFLASAAGERSRQRTMFWHELLSAAGSADDRGMLRICFIPQQGRSSSLPSLFLAKLAKISGYAAEAMWQLLLEVEIEPRWNRDGTEIAPR